MRRLLLVLLLALPTVVLAADAKDGQTPAPTASAGSSGAAGDADHQAQPADPTPAPAPPPVAADPADCRMNCAQTYYFCREGSSLDACGDSWGQCVAACDSPDLNPGVSTAP